MAAPLQLGMFVMPIHDPEKPMAQCFDEDIDLALKCEELGYTDFWVGEHHTSTYENIVMPEIFLAKVLGMTENMRVGPAPVCLQYHHQCHLQLLHLVLLLLRFLSFSSMRCGLLMRGTRG